jgi:hypothetical protein
MNDTLRKFLHKFVTVYLDDVCIYTHTLEEHLDHMRLVLQRFKEDGLKLRLKKYFFGLQEMKYLRAILCQHVKFRFPQRKSRPLQTGQCLRRRRRLEVLYSFATSMPYLFIISATLRLH